VIVVPGGVYAAGPHRFVCGDIEDGALERLYSLLPERPAMVYSDPPWNAGNARYWRTQAGLGRAVDWETLWCLIADFTQRTGAPDVWFEMSLSQTETWLQIVTPYLPPLVGLWQVYYGSPPTVGPYIHCCGRPNNIARFARHTCVPLPDMTGLKGEAVTNLAFRSSLTDGACGIVVDPCIGKGMTARMACSHGLTCYGAELNPKRLSVTLAWFEKRGYALDSIMA